MINFIFIGRKIKTFSNKYKIKFSLFFSDKILDGYQSVFAYLRFILKIKNRFFR